MNEWLVVRWMNNSIAQLEELNKNPGSLQDMVDNMDTVQSMTSVRDGMDNDVEQIASMYHSVSSILHYHYHHHLLWL